MKHLLLIVLFLIQLYADDIVKTEVSVIDTKNQLEWQDNAEAKEEIWKMASAYCKQLEIGMNNDWRLPTPKELQLLSKRKILKENFKYLEEGVYWSNAIDKRDEFSAITVYTGNGFISSSDKCEKYFIVCVRDTK